MNFKPFGTPVGKLGNLEWADVTAGQDGESWIVQEKGGAGYIFRVSLSDRERNSAPMGTALIQREGFPTSDEIRQAIAIAIQRHLVSPGYELIRPRQEYAIKLTCFDLYEAAGAL